MANFSKQPVKFFMNMLTAVCAEPPEKLIAYDELDSLYEAGVNEVNYKEQDVDGRK